ncbi:MAG: hypothetical protein LBD95_03325 [Clostridiales Family XIII bacterium]|jgi:hypothetical protein|nr:hypothetical protein [Clostridiales Family XIII bacterium]
MYKFMKKRTLSALTALFLLLALFAGLPASASAASGNWTDSGNYDTTWYTSNPTATAYTIGTAAELAGLSVLTNGMYDSTPVPFTGVTITLGADIDLSAHYWTVPIGEATIVADLKTNYSPAVVGGHKFAGTFDGAGNGIAGVTIGKSTTNGTGLFGYLSPTGTIEDLTVSGSVSVMGAQGEPNDATGGVVAYNSGTINKVTNNTIVTGSSYCYNIGGIAGFNNHLYPDPDGDTPVGVIANCTNTAAIAGHSKVGGITGENAGAIGTSSNSGPISNVVSGKNGAGGIAGRNGDNNVATETGVIINCYNSADISSADGRWFGGIVGFQNALSSVTNCYDTGDLLGGYDDYAPIIGQDEGRSTLVYSLEELNHHGSLAVVGTIEDAEYLQSGEFLDTLNANSIDLGFGDAWIQGMSGYPDLTYNAPAPSPSGGGGTPNNYSTIYLSGNGDDDNTGGTPTDPVATLEKALGVAAMSTDPDVSISVMDTITVTTGQRALAGAIPVNWTNASTTGPMFVVADDGALLIGGLLISGKSGSANIDTALIVEDGGSLTLRNNAGVQDCAVGIDVEAGGNLTLNRSSVAGTRNSVRFTAGTGGAFTLFAGPDQVITLTGTVWLYNGAQITIGSAVSSGIVVESNVPSDGLVVAWGTADYQLNSHDAAAVTYAGGGFVVGLDPNNALILKENR